MKKTRHQEMKHDFLTSFAFKAYDYVKNNTTVVTITLASVIVAIVLISLVVRNRGTTNEALEKDMTEAILSYAMLNNNKIKPEQKEQFLQRAKELFARIQKDYASNNRAYEAAFYLADIEYREGKPEDAMNMYKQYIEKYGKKDPFFKESSELAIAQCKEDMGKTDEAMAVYTNMAKSSKYPLIVTDAKRGEYRVFLKQKKLKEAYNVIDDLIKTVPESYDTKVLELEHMTLAKKLGLPTLIEKKKEKPPADKNTKKTEGDKKQ